MTDGECQHKQVPYLGEEFGVPPNLLIIGTTPPVRGGGPVDCTAGRGVATAVPWKVRMMNAEL